MCSSGLLIRATMVRRQKMQIPRSLWRGSMPILGRSGSSALAKHVPHLTLTASGGPTLGCEGREVHTDFGSAELHALLEVGEGDVGLLTAGVGFLAGALAGPLHHAEDHGEGKDALLDFLRDE